MKILLAEDVAATRRLVEATLVRLGHEVRAVADGAAAWDAFGEFAPDIIVLDWQLPILDGLEVCRRVRAAEAGRDTFVLMLTSRDGTLDLRDALAAGVDDYLTKLAGPQHLTARIAIAERHVAGRRAQRAAEDEAQRARWLVGVNETTVAMQHELNNPLAALLMTLAVEEQLSEPGDRRDAIAMAVTQARRVADVVQRMRSLRDPQSVEYLPGIRMLDIGGASRADGSGEVA